MKIFVMAHLFLLFSSISFAGENDKEAEKVIYKYKKYEKFDLGDLEIKGVVVAPGDLTVKDRSIKQFRRGLYDRVNFDKEIKENIKNLR